ncbi:VUT family protein [Xenorhabdus bovienii]|uniref:VUT family protein n=1 Tax=Xenorhabdus bovienii TaxID=40576 RepID=UPI0023B34C24|nr:VUT family protein [Xenorhabdus bovienii]MDE9459994.1 VUT family protein [Xenorhabdus bovienii]MDE9469227.1 VUT family protein [Xenorhabdus bovienii]
MTQNYPTHSKFKYDSLFISLSVTIMITCDVLVYKTLDFYDFKITFSGILFSFYFLISTIQTEVYGYRQGVKTVWIMVLCQSIFVMVIFVASHMQPENNQISMNFKSLFGEFWRVMVGTWTSVPISYFINGFVISSLKKVFLGRFFFIRYLIASMTTQAALLLSAYPISLSSKYNFNELITIIITTWSYKVVMSIILLPIGIILADKVKKLESADVYDWGISYNPFFLRGNKK